MKKSFIAATVILSLSMSATGAFAEYRLDGTPSPNQVKDADGNIIIQTLSAPIGDVPPLPIQDVHDANGNVIGQTRDAKPQDSFGGLHYVIVVGGKALEAGSRSAYLKNERLLVPLREISEALGYKVTWNADTYSVDVTKGAVWSGVFIGKDNYSFGKMAPVQLGAAPELKDEVTYVPLTFFSDILKLKTQIDETGVVNISEVQG
ncbi:copper amine oxidase N-terminal domain-containing protein [Paenibacillus allorhizosphaerae]|uniref:Copper amine oxidase-like N-terminal domain-containing protein n=1 Tax=Paenibacillus allorhizosphaerae TaxID=2849866 RepID=A0ABM8VA13_9BACL|nr:copper amine oxidase N-terminal domain-containing protein [Paenibacillus allorhizosphaerae]CAG7615134.1 hypothetical protein PAECIP111802_00141 [Paenibacillus allorhizosphaerae]